MEPWQRLRAFLEAPASDVRTVARSEAEVVAIELRYGLRLPADYRALLLNASPVREDDLDAEFGSWWPPERVRNIPDEGIDWVRQPDILAEPSAYLFFADQLFWCWAWAMNCGEGPNRGRIALLGGARDRFVADSFDEFVTRYLSDWSSLC